MTTPIDGCRNGHPNTDWRPRTWRTKSGEQRSGWQCRSCRNEARHRYEAAHPEQVEAARNRYEEKRRGVTLAQRRERFLELDRAGRNATQIAAAMGVTTRTVTRWRASNGLSKQAPKRTRTQDERDQVRRLIEDGCSMREAGLTIGVTWFTVRRWFPDAPRYTPQEAGRNAQLHRLELKVMRAA